MRSPLPEKAGTFYFADIQAETGRYRRAEHEKGLLSKQTVCMVFRRVHCRSFARRIPSVNAAWRAAADTGVTGEKDSPLRIQSL